MSEPLPSAPETRPFDPDAFIHLHLHTSYSLLDGAVKISKLAAKVKEHRMPAVAITDHGNMFGVVQFYKEMTKKDVGVKPIIGVEAYVAERDHLERDREETRHHLVLLARDETGYENLCRLISLANLEGFYHKPRIDKALLNRHREGLIGLSACLKGEVPYAILQHRPKDAQRLAGEYAEILGEGNFYIELQKNGLASQEEVNRELVALARRLKLPLVATNDVHYLEPGDTDAHDTMLAIGHGKLKSDPGRMRYETDCLYLRSTAEMWELFSEVPEAILNTRVIAERCNVTLELGKPHLPTFEVPEGYDPAGYFEKLAREGLKERLATLGYPADRAAYEARLEYEIGVIRNMQFPGYFLIVADFINYAKTQGIPVGPGRGSGAGSLVAFALGITDLDPIPYGLYFERFLNPARISLPDFDVDFCMNRRGEVIRYVTEKYGADRVGQIVTFGSLKARGVVRDVCRALDIPVAEAGQIAKLVPEGPKTTLDSALAEEPRLKEALDQNPTYARMYETARQLEGLHRHTGVHAAGVVISERPLWQMVPVLKGEEGLVTQYAKDEVEAVGLVKFDFLGLKTLTVLDEAVKLVNRERAKKGEEPLDLKKLPFDDPKVYALISTGNTTGVFQMESEGFQRFIKKLKPNRFEDVIMAVAFYRPGPMKYIDDCVDRKQGRQRISYDHPVLEKILGETYGFMVYQEQIMQIAAEVAGFSMAEADELRKVIAKKIPDKMPKMLQKFHAGASAKGYRDDFIRKLCDDMIAFANYGFNKSHAAAYSVITYHTAWMKTYHPVPFMAATLTCEMEHTDKVARFVHEARSLNLALLPPCVNRSEREFTVEEGKIRYGLGAVKGVGQGAIEAVVEARRDRPVESLFDLCSRVDLGRVNRKVVEAFIKSGAFDALGVGRSRLAAALDSALELGHTRLKERQSGQTNLLDLFAAAPKKKRENGGAAPDLQAVPSVPEWTEKERLANEFEALGLFLSAHPMDRFQKAARRYARQEIAQVLPSRGREEVVLVGIIVGLRDRLLKDGVGRMATFRLEDSSGFIECALFSRKYEANAPCLTLEEPVIVRGRLIVESSGEETNMKVGVEEMIPLMEKVKEGATRLHLYLPPESDDGLFSSLSDLIRSRPGRCAIHLHAVKEWAYDVLMALPETFGVEPGADLFDRFEALLGRDSVWLE